MEQNYRFVFQENMFWGSCEPCTASVFNKLVRSNDVAWKIGTRQAVERAISLGFPLDAFVQMAQFQAFCKSSKAGADFQSLAIEKKLLRWVQSLKTSLPDFVFAVNEFMLVQRTDKEGNPKFDAQGNPMMYHERKQSNILRTLRAYSGTGFPLESTACPQNIVRQWVENRKRVEPGCRKHCRQPVPDGQGTRCAGCHWNHRKVCMRQ